MGWPRLGGRVTPALPCVLHGSHSPVHRTVEFHHVIPVAWQLCAQPAKPWQFEGKDPDGRGLLFDARGVECCPTGHRNVHLWITRLTHALPAGSESVSAATSVVRAAYGRTSGLEFDTARLALSRWREAGLSLQTLVALHEWGQSLPAPRPIADVSETQRVAAIRSVRVPARPEPVGSPRARP